MPAADFLFTTEEHGCGEKRLATAFFSRFQEKVRIKPDTLSDKIQPAQGQNGEVARDIHRSDVRHGQYHNRPGGEVSLALTPALFARPTDRDRHQYINGSSSSQFSQKRGTW